MRRKIYFLSIPMLPASALRKIQYKKEDKGQILSVPSCFPAIPILDWTVSGGEEIKIITIRTDDDNGRTEANYQVFKKELSELSDSLGRPLDISGEIILPHTETKDKQVQLVKEVCACMEPDCDIYMDITFGTKITSVGLFTSLVYAEKIMNCDIRSVFYGKYPHDDSLSGELYDVRCLYELSMIFNASDLLGKEALDDLLGTLWGKQE